MREQSKQMPQDTLLQARAGLESLIDSSVVPVAVANAIALLDVLVLNAPDAQPLTQPKETTVFSIKKAREVLKKLPIPGTSERDIQKMRRELRRKKVQMQRNSRRLVRTTIEDALLRVTSGSQMDHTAFASISHSHPTFAALAATALIADAAGTTIGNRQLERDHR